ncbi:MAG: tetratricopeptide repeat protein [Prevotella sp.]|nr:tetratricopeptide repeat protein [Prevotella sp.]
MGFLKTLFNGKVETPEEKKKEEESRNFDVLKYDGVKALRLGESAHAVELFTRALEMQDDLEVRDYLSQALIHVNRLEEAYEQLQKLAEAEPENVQLLVRMTDVAYMLEDYDRMEELCERAMLIDKDNPMLMVLYARACIGRGDLVNAVAMLTRAITLREDNGDARLLRGDTLLEMGDVESADEDAKWLDEHSSGIEEVLLLNARIEERKGNHEKSIEYYNKVVKANPFHAAAFKERGAVRLALGDKEGAEADMHSYLELNPEEMDGVNGEYSAEGTEDIGRTVEQAYRNSNPFGLG